MFSIHTPNRQEDAELWWQDRYDEIAEHGYELRPRLPVVKEDGQPTMLRPLRAAMGAIYVRDNLQVILKRVLPEEGSYELSINMLFSSPEFATIPNNHFAPLLDVIELQRPEPQKLMVFPLMRPFNQSEFQTFGEFVAFFTQICQGIRFMHERNVAHRDFTANNIMFGASSMHPNGFYPTEINRNRSSEGTAMAYTRTQLHPASNYYLICSGLSRQYTSRDVTDEPLPGVDTSASEYRLQGLCNPFQTDIYCIGNLVRQEFMERCSGFAFMEDLVKWMTLDDPAKRPRIEEVLERFTRIRASLSNCKLRSHIPSKRTPKLFGVQWAKLSLRMI